MLATEKGGQYCDNVGAGVGALVGRVGARVGTRLGAEGEGVLSCIDFADSELKPEC